MGREIQAGSVLVPLPLPNTLPSTSPYQEAGEEVGAFVPVRGIKNGARNSST